MGDTMTDSDFKCVLVVLLAGLGILCATIVVCMAIGTYMDCQYIKAGYTHKMLPGEHHPQWVKELSCGPCGAGNKGDGR